MCFQDQKQMAQPGSAGSKTDVVTKILRAKTAARTSGSAPALQSTWLAASTASAAAQPAPTYATGADAAAAAVNAQIASIEAQAISTLAAASLASTAQISGVHQPRPFIVGNTAQEGHSITVGTGITAAKTTNNTAVNALAVPAADSNYLAATGVALTGTGMKIGILSDSFNLTGGEAADISDGDLPAASQIHIVQEGGSGSDEGRALAELIHSIAPGAQLYFYTGTSTETGFATGINTLVSLGMNVIIDDITYTDEPFYQDTGVITKAVENAIGAGVSYFSSAGNSSDNFYEAAFAPITFALPGIGTETTHNVSAGSPYEAVALGTNARLDFTVQWTQPFGANQYDIGVGLYSKNASTGAYTLVQNFTASSLGGNPELLNYSTVAVSAGTYYLAFYESSSNLVNGAAVAPGTFKIIFWPDSAATVDGTGAGVGSGTSLGHALAPAVNTVGAISVYQTPSQGVAVPVVEPYSAAGQGETYINAAGVTLANPINDLSPNFSATDGSPTSVFNPFDGTSAAAANAAAVSLLVLQADPHLLPVQVTYLLMRSAISANDTPDGGAGLIQASSAVAGALAADTAPVWTGQASSTSWNAAANWSDGSVPGAGSVVSIVDGIGLLSGAYTVGFNVASANLTGLQVDGKNYTHATPNLMIATAEILTAGAVTLGAGTIAVAGTLSDTGALLAGSALGTIDVAGTGVLKIAGAVAAEGIEFVGTGGDVVFSTAVAATLLSGLDATISGFAAGDMLDLAGLAVTSVAAITESGSTVTLTDAAGDAIATLQLSGSFTQLGFADDGHGGTQIETSASVNGPSYQNLNVAGLSGAQTVPADSVASNQLLVSNMDSTGATVAGAASVSLTVPSGYTSLQVEAPGAETITGNGANEFQASFGANSSVNFTSNGGSGTIAANGTSDSVLLTGSAWAVTGSTLGGNSFELLSTLAAITTAGGVNTIFAVGTSDTIVSAGTGDTILDVAGPGTSAVVTVSGAAAFVGRNGAYTITAVGSGSVNAVLQPGASGSMDFINNSTVASLVNGASGSLTAFGGAGGGLYSGGGQGQNSLAGGSGNAWLVGSAAGNDTLIANGSIATAVPGGGGALNFNILVGGATDSTGAVTSAGNQTMLSNASAGETLFEMNRGNDQVSAAGGQTQYFFLNAVGNATISGSAAATQNQFYLTQSSRGGGTSDVIQNFSLARDQFDVINSSGVTIAAVTPNQVFYNNSAGVVSGTDIALSNGSHIKLVGLTFTQAQIASITGGTSF
jgi:hypothetical protein